MRRLVIALALVGLLGAACGDTNNSYDEGPNPNAIVRLRGPESGTTVRGNTVTLRVAADGVRIVKADGNTSGDTAHYHVFIDQAPVAPGGLIPKTKDIVHTAEAPIVLTGLTEGLHQIYVVLGDGTHHRLGRTVVHTSVHVEGPSVRATAPATAKVGEAVTLDVETEGVRIVAANGDTSGRSGHLHVFIDRPPTPAGQPIPRDATVIHTTDKKIAIPAFTTPGEHTLWVVLGDGNHTPFAPPVMDKVTITIS